MRRRLGPVGAILLTVLFGGPIFADRPEWIAQPKTRDTYFTYTVGNATKATKQSARDAAFEDALDALARSITSRPREFDLLGVEIIKGCEYYQGFSPFVQCWVQVSFPIKELAAIQTRIERGNELNELWMQVQIESDAGRFDVARDILRRLRKGFGEGLYLDYTLSDIDLRVAESFLQEGRTEAAVKAYRERLGEGPEGLQAAEGMLLAGDQFLDQDRPEDADKVYREILEISPENMEVQEQAIASLFALGEYFREQGDFPMAWNYYSLVRDDTRGEEQVRAQARTQLEAIPQPPRAWQLHQTLKNHPVGLLCALEESGASRPFDELFESLSPDLRDARARLQVLTDTSLYANAALEQVFERSDFSPILTAKSGLNYIYAIHVKVDPERYGSRQDALVRLKVYDCREKVLVMNISFRERWGDVPPAVMADHAAGVLIFRYLCPRPEGRPWLGVLPFEAGTGVGGNLAELMTDSFTTAISQTDRFRMRTDPNAAFYRALPAVDRQDPRYYEEYGKSGSNLRFKASVVKVGDTYHLNSEMLDMERTGALEQASTEFKIISGQFLEYEMRRHLAELLDLSPPKKPWGRRGAEIIRGTYSGLSKDLAAVEEPLKVDIDRLETGSLNAQERQKKVVVDNDLPIQARTRKSEISFCLLPPGSLLSADGKSIEAVSAPIYVSRFEITQKQWRAVMRDTGDDFLFDGDDRPMVNISIGEAREFCQRLCELEGAEKEDYRLLTGLEWEYACRAGTLTPYYNGESSQDLRKIAWFEESMRGTSSAREVGKLRPNAWGLYDMLGNVWEWTLGESEDSGTPRGGSWASPSDECRAGFLPAMYPPRASVIGFRVVRVFPVEPAE